MKSIMISIKPEWNGKILNRDKTLEIRTTCPKEWKDYLNGKSKIKPEPMQVFIYCTKEKSYMDRLVQNHNGFYYTVRELVEYDADDYGLYYDIAGFNGQVLAEFTLNKVTKHEKNFIDFNDDICYNFKVVDVKNAGWDTDELSLVDFDAFIETYGNDKPLYAWKIENLKIYKEPKELSEFGVKRAFQSWGYVNGTNH